MAIPQPVPGLVVHYLYLWHNEYLRGLEEGGKSRPCVVASVMNRGIDGLIVIVAPITHRCPSDLYGIELPAVTKRRLGLDAQSSWVIASDLNSFVWPGFDLRHVPGRSGDIFSYGVLPPRLFRRLRAAIQTAATTRAVRATPR